VENPRNGIYSYFIRGTDVRLTSRDVEVLKQHATKVVEGGELILIIGKNWIVMVRKLHGHDYECIRIRCFGDVCEPHREIEAMEVMSEVFVATTVEVTCRRESEISENIDDYVCEIRYNYIAYDATIAITIDPLDIDRLNNDREIQLLLDLMKTDRILVRPM